MCYVQAKVKEGCIKYANIVKYLKWFFINIKASQIHCGMIPPKFNIQNLRPTLSFLQNTKTSCKQGSVMKFSLAVISVCPPNEMFRPIQRFQCNISEKNIIYIKMKN
eukprot:TRINITY_DN11982_c1_g1_i2.p1 TRINITY_DN11982_c1_g1~~TRINITY_DN11982_c1_g1_i2.p1  ORF type:complete len:107 (+),score=6.99 TRINITY_DN11982_c1_g1_i2:745-1065(+)